MSGLDVNAILDELQPRKLPTEAQIKELCEKAIAIFGEEDNVQPVQAPVTICGDLHGELPSHTATRANDVVSLEPMGASGGDPRCARPR
mgnify:CR=1 FL=1